MHRSQQPRRRPGWVALVALFSLSALLAVAGLAWADGEDDPSFNGSGTVYVPTHEGTEHITPPVVDQAADGTIVSAVGLQELPFRRGIGSFSSMNVVRYSAAGGVLGSETYGTLRFTYDQRDGTTFDVEAKPDGSVVIAYAGYPARGGRSNDHAPLLGLLDIAANGTHSDEAFFAPDGCSAVETTAARDALETPIPSDADIAPDGTIYVAWNGCADDTAWLATYKDGQFVNARSTDVNGYAEEVVVAPSGNVFVAFAGEFGGDELPERRGTFDFGLALVTKHDPTSLVRDPGYGNDGEDGAILPGYPLDLTVDHQDRAVVWVTSPDKRRGSNGVPIHLIRLDAAGDIDTSWGEAGLSVLDHPSFGEPNYCDCEDPAHLTAQTDGKIVILGPSSAHADFSDRGAGARPAEWFVARTTAEGDLDPTWGEDPSQGGDGVRTFDIDDATFNAYLFFIGEPTLQTDGKLLVPFGAFDFSDVPGRIPGPTANGADHLGLSRLSLTPATPPKTEQPVTPAAPPSPPAQVTVAASKAAKTCKSRRSFTIRLRTGRKKADRSPIKSAVVRVNGKKVKVTKGARSTSKVVLTQLPKGRFTVQIRLVLEDGGKVKDDRRYRTCAKKIESELKPLRTTPPKR